MMKFKLVSSFIDLFVFTVKISLKLNICINLCQHCSEKHFKIPVSDPVSKIKTFIESLYW